MKRKTLPILLILVGLALLIIAFSLWYDRLTGAEPASLSQELRDWLTTLFGLGASLEGWRRLLKKEGPQPPAGPTTSGDRSPASGGNGDIIQTEGGDVYKAEQITIHEPHRRDPPADALGYLPPCAAATYIPRGVEDSVLNALLGGEHSAIVGVTGAGGLGKTELAKRIAQSVREHFEGVLWLDLGGRRFDEALGDLLTALGVRSEPGQSRHQRLVRLWNAWKGRHLLVVFDDVRRGLLADLGELLPPPPNAALLTSRVREIGAAPRVFRLGEFTPEQARQLLETVLGAPAVAAEEDAAADLARRCGYNPLALDIAARRIRQMHGLERPIAAFLERSRARLAELRLPDQPRWDVEWVIGLSYDDLDAADQRRFRALGLFTQRDADGFLTALDFSLGCAAAVWEEPAASAREPLARLVHLSLVDPHPGPGERYRLHDLIAEFAAGRLAGDERAAAETRLEAWLAHWFHENHVPRLEVLDRGLAERPVLLLACRNAATRGDDTALARLATYSRNWFYVHFTENWNEWHARLIQAAAVDDPTLRARVLQAIGDVQRFRQQNDAALQSYQQALAIYRQIGDRLGEANALAALSRLLLAAGDLPAAEARLRDALELRRAIHDRHGEGADLGNFAVALLQAGQPHKALAYAQLAREIFVEFADDRLIDHIDHVIAVCREGPSEEPD